jgi:hypothetical protein
VVPEERFTRLLTGFLTSSLRVSAEVANFGASFTVSNARVATPPSLPSDRGGVFTRGGKKRNKTGMNAQIVPGPFFITPARLWSFISCRSPAGQRKG